MTKKRNHIAPLTELSEEMMSSYLRDRLSPSERHAVEKFLLDHPFEAEAMEGYEMAQMEMTKGLDTLKEKIDRMTQRDDEKIIPIWRRPLSMAAAIAVLIVGSVIIIGSLKIFESEAPVVMKQEEKKAKEAPIQNKVSPPLVDTKVKAKETTKTIPQSTPKRKERIQRQDLSQKQKTGSEEITLSNEKYAEPTTQEPVQEMVAMAENDSHLDEAVLSDHEVTMEEKPSEPEFFQADEEPEAPEEEMTLVKERNTGMPRSMSRMKKSFSGSLKETSPSEITEMSSSGDVSLVSAVPENGYKSFRKYLKKNLTYPTEARKNKVEGEVVVHFTVDAHGDLKDFNIKQSLGFGCDEEAVRLIEEGPSWNPATQGGTPLDEQVEVQVKFELD